MNSSEHSEGDSRGIGLSLRRQRKRTTAASVAFATVVDWSVRSAPRRAVNVVTEIRGRFGLEVSA